MVGDQNIQVASRIGNGSLIFGTGPCPRSGSCDQQQDLLSKCLEAFDYGIDYLRGLVRKVDDTH